MMNSTLKTRELFLNWYTAGLFYFNTRYMSVKEKRNLIINQFAQIKNLSDLFEAYYDTSVFRSEMIIEEHGYSCATGSSFDKLLVSFRKEWYVVDDKHNFVARYNGSNGFE
jgi:hypothetical protein